LVRREIESKGLKWEEGQQHWFVAHRFRYQGIEGTVSFAFFNNRLMTVRFVPNDAKRLIARLGDKQGVTFPAV